MKLIYFYFIFPTVQATPPPSFQSPGLVFSIVIPQTQVAAFNAAQQQKLCSTVTTGFDVPPSNISCTVGSVSAWNGTDVLASGYAFFTWTATPTVTQLNIAGSLRDARVTALTTNAASILGAAFPGAYPNVACLGTAAVTASGSVAFTYNTNLTGIPGPVQCGARLTYDSNLPAAVLHHPGYGYRGYCQWPGYCCKY